jgi:hypothetical protein
MIQPRLSIRTSFFLAVLLAEALTVAAQVRPRAPIRPPEPIRGAQADQQPAQGGGSITVEGCLRGTSLEPVKDDVILTMYGAHEYDLQISRALNERLRGHQGHTERVVGTLMVPADPDRTALATTIGGRTQIAASTSSGRPPQGAPFIAVKSVEHIADRCGVSSKRDPSPDRSGSATTVPK